LAEVEGLFGPRTGLTPSGPATVRCNVQRHKPIDHDAARLISRAPTPSHRGRYPATTPKTRKPAGRRALHFWLGWQDSNLRMAGSKPAIVTSIINKLSYWNYWPSGSPSHPSVPHRCHQTSHQRLVNGRRNGPGSRADESSSAACNSEPSNGTHSRYTISATDASPGAIRRSRGKSHFVW